LRISDTSKKRQEQLDSIHRGVKSKQRIGKDNFIDDLDKIRLLIKKRFFVEEIAAMYDVDDSWAKEILGREGK